jgi:hypothetical protein
MLTAIPQDVEVCELKDNQVLIPGLVDAHGMYKSQSMRFCYKYIYIPFFWALSHLKYRHIWQWIYTLFQPYVTYTIFCLQCI